MVILNSYVKLPEGILKLAVSPPSEVTFAQVLHIPEALWRLGTGCEATPGKLLNRQKLRCQ